MMLFQLALLGKKKTTRLLNNPSQLKPASNMTKLINTLVFTTTLTFPNRPQQPLNAECSS